MIGLSASAREAKLRNFRRRVSARGDHYCTLWADRLAWTLLDGRLGNRSRSIIILYHRTPHVLVLLWWAASLSGDDCRTDDSAGDTGDAWTLASFIIACRYLSSMMAKNSKWWLLRRKYHRLCVCASSSALTRIIETIQCHCWPMWR